MNLWSIFITRTRDSEAMRIYQYLCEEHVPVQGGTLTPYDEPEATISFASSRPATAHEVANFGADECDACAGHVTLRRPGHRERKQGR